MGDKLTSQDRKLTKVVLEAHRRGFTIKSDFARSHADYVAMASSLGLLSTRLWGNVFSREWRPTMKGLGFLSITLGEDFKPEEELDWGHSESTWASHRM